MQIIKFQGKNQITIPKELVEYFHLAKGDILKCEAEGSHIIF